MKSKSFTKKLVLIILISLLVFFAFGCSPETTHTFPLLVYESTEFRIYISEAITDGYNIMIKFQIDERVSTINFESLFAQGKIEILSDTINYRSFKQFNCNSVQKNYSTSTIDMYFTAFVTNVPFHSILLSDIWIGSTKIIDELKLTPVMEATEFVCLSGNVSKNSDYQLNRLIVSDMGFYCEMENEPGITPFADSDGLYMLELHFENGDILYINCNSFSNGISTPNSWVIAAMYSNYPEIYTTKGGVICKIVVEGVVCTRP